MGAFTILFISTYMSKSYARIILILALIAIPITLYLLYLHFYPSESFCNINAVWDCNTVNQSKYAVFLGVPTALWGFLTYTFIAIWMALELTGAKLLNVLSPMMRSQLFLSMVTLCFLFALYLSYIEFFVLKTICMLCLAQQCIILVIAVVAVFALKKLK